MLSGEDKILRSIGCRKDDSSYLEFKKAFLEVKDESVCVMRPRAAAVIGKIPAEFPRSVRFYGREIIFFMITLGSEIVVLSDKYMKKGEFIKGMLVDGIAGDCLFSCEKIVLHEIEKHARKEGFGIEGIYDAPEAIEGKMQKLIAAMLDAEKNLGVTVTENYMLSPVKTYACVMPLLDDVKVMNVYHDCSKCNMKKCSYRG